MINKRYKNDGGGLSEEEQKDFNEKYGELLLKEKEFQIVQLNLQDDEEITDKARQGKLQELVDEMEVLKSDLEKFNEFVPNRFKLFDEMNFNMYPISN